MEGGEEKSVGHIVCVLIAVRERLFSESNNPEGKIVCVESLEISSSN